jgi:hypothetical protein
MSQPLLKIENLHARVEDKAILQGLNLEIRAGEVHALMGPNGSGKSTLAHVLAGREGYEVTEGRVLYDGKDLFALEPEERAREGVFLAFQYPVELPGVNNTYFLKASVNAVRKHRGEEELDAIDFLELVNDKMKPRPPAPARPTPASSSRGAPAGTRRPGKPAWPAAPGSLPAAKDKSSHSTRADSPLSRRDRSASVVGR